MFSQLNLVLLDGQDGDSVDEAEGGVEVGDDDDFDDGDFDDMEMEADPYEINDDDNYREEEDIAYVSTTILFEKLFSVSFPVYV